MGTALVLWIHIIAATIFVGPQVFLFAAAVPAMRTIDDVAARARATRVVTMRFGFIATGALLVLIATGIGNYISANDRGLLDLDRYFFVLQIKLTLVAIVLLLTLAHGAILGRRLLRLTESGASEAEIAAARRWSLAASVAIFLLSVAILLCAALLASDWTKQ
jgi:uncharacterized membrane protein